MLFLVAALGSVAAVVLLVLLGAVSHKFDLAHSGGSSILADSVTVTGELATEANIAVPASTTNQQENIAFNHTNLRGIYIKSDVTVTIKTNSSGSPDNTFTITAGVPFVWYYQSGVTNPVSAAVTTIYLTNATTGAANVYIRTLVA